MSGWAPASYISASDCLIYVDFRIFKELLKDDDTPLADAAAVAANATFGKLLQAVSGLVEVLLVGTGRCTVEQLQGLSGNALEYFNRLLARMVAVEAYDRRPDLSAEQKPRFYDEARAELAALADGDMFLPSM